jgi:hypothetical protein
MTTTARGEEFEKQIYNDLEQMVLDGRFFARKECCRVFHKKGYFSKDRQKEIVFDVAVEISLPGSDEPSVLVLIECKNYAGRVPVDDIEEFYAKVQQIAPAGLKAIVASRSSFQEGAFAFAKSKGIGLLRHFSPDSLEWVLRRSASGSVSAGNAASNAYYALRQQDFLGSYFDYFCFFGEKYTASLFEFFGALLRDILTADDAAAVETDADPRFTVPFLTNDQIELECKKLRSEIGYDGGEVSTGDICALLAETHGLHVRDVKLSRGVLGAAEFHPPTIEIDYSQANNDRQIRFTLCHEIGHIVLGHGAYMVRDICHQSDVDIENPPRFAIQDLVRMEWQANHFAACLLLPAESVIAAAMAEAAAIHLVDRGHGLIFLDGQRCNFESFYQVTSPLMAKFNVSRSVIKIRLTELGLIRNALVEAKGVARHIFLRHESH